MVPLYSYHICQTQSFFISSLFSPVYVSVYIYMTKKAIVHASDSEVWNSLDREAIKKYQIHSHAQSPSNVFLLYHVEVKKRNDRHMSAISKNENRRFLKTEMDFGMISEKSRFHNYHHPPLLSVPRKRQHKVTTANTFFDLISLQIKSINLINHERRRAASKELRRKCTNSGK